MSSKATRQNSWALAQHEATKMFKHLGAPDEKRQCADGKRAFERESMTV